MKYAKYNLEIYECQKESNQKLPRGCTKDIISKILHRFQAFSRMSACINLSACKLATEGSCSRRQQLHLEFIVGLTKTRLPGMTELSHHNVVFDTIQIHDKSPYVC